MEKLLQNVLSRNKLFLNLKSKATSKEVAFFWIKNII
jgi:hypothetical protein